MKKTVLIAFAVAILSVVMAQPVQSAEYPLYAGQDMPVGTVKVTPLVQLGDPIIYALKIKYILDVDCLDVELTETHLHLATNPPGATGPGVHKWPVTGKKGNPKIGKFEYSGEDEYIILYEDIPPDGAEIGDTIYIAAHAVTGTVINEIEYCGVDDLPEFVTGEVCWPTGDASKYFELTITDDGVLDGMHDAWCADPGLKVGLLDALGNCTGDVDWAVVTDVPSEINCLLNLIYRGETAAFNTGDLQLAMWILIEGLENLEALELAHPGKTQKMIDYYLSDEGTVEANVAAILEMVAEGCDGFEPGCCDVMGVFLVPVEPRVEEPEELRQPILIAIPAPCCETAWGDAIEGIQFSEDNGWATYFVYPPVVEP